LVGQDYREERLSGRGGGFSTKEATFGLGLEKGKPAVSQPKRRRKRSICLVYFAFQGH
jgi:hypothetical protein